MIAGTALAVAACMADSPRTAPDALPVPGAISLIATMADGQEYVIDYNLSPSDCETYALRAARANRPARITLTCHVQP